MKSKKLLALIGLALILMMTVWLRGHTVGPSVRDRLGVNLWFVTDRESEPLDCDEAIYAYIGKRLGEGSVMYRDLTENKPPLGYWLYAIAVAIGGPNEWCIRLMPLAYVLPTLIVIWAIGRKLGVRPETAGLTAAFLFAIWHVDPYLFGNGANMEHFLNLFSTAGLGCGILAVSHPNKWKPWAAAGCFVALASLVKQVAVLQLFSLGLFVLLTSAQRWRSLLALAVGFTAPWLIAALILIIQGAGYQAWDDMIRYGGALATDTPTPLHSPPGWLRWLTGNADPTPSAPDWNQGGLPWPFGPSVYYAWWGAGSWPLWLASIPAALVVLASSLFSKPMSAPRLLLTVWLFTAWLQTALPGLYWQHYYLLPVPASSLIVGLAIADLFQSRSNFGAFSQWAKRLGGLVLIGLTLVDVGLLFKNYLSVPPQNLAIQYKGGRQWIALREEARQLKRKSRAGATANLKNPQLVNWGWQSPLFIYGEFDSPTRQVFVDPLMQAFAPEGTHPIIEPRLKRIIEDIRREKPLIIFCGYPPFPALRELLAEQYSAVSVFGPKGEGLWVEKSRETDFRR